MSSVPTVKVVDIATNVVMIINECDFDVKSHKLYKDPDNDVSVKKSRLNKGVLDGLSNKQK